MRFARLIIEDADRAHAANRASYERGLANLKLPESKLKRILDEQVGLVRPVGTHWGDSELDCPDGNPNCRNCGDPEFADACKASGHCEYCGIHHGTAPDSVLTKNGLRFDIIEEVALKLEQEAREVERMVLIRERMARREG